MAMRFDVPPETEVRFHCLPIGERECVCDLDAYLLCDRGSAPLTATRLMFKVTKNYAPR